MRYLLTLATLLCLSSPAIAHSWYSEQRDPIFNATTCCGGSDCAPLPPHAISYMPDGSVRVTLTLAEAQKINPARFEPFDEVIPFERIQRVPPEGSAGPHICLMPSNRAAYGDKRQGFYCFFLPDGG